MTIVYIDCNNSLENADLLVTMEVNKSLVSIRVPCKIEHTCPHAELTADVIGVTLVVTYLETRTVQWKTCMLR